MGTPWRRAWVKMFVEESLGGTIRFEMTAAQRGVWYDLIMLSARCRTPGIISANENQPYPHRYIAGVLNIDEALLEETLEICKEKERIAENEHGIVILNWDKYQSEYQRQKPYRQKAKGGASGKEGKGFYCSIHQNHAAVAYKGESWEECEWLYCQQCFEEAKEKGEADGLTEIHLEES